jgi:hypothetical protein
MRPWNLIPSFTARDPAMLKWSGLLVRLGSGRWPHFSEYLFSQLDNDLLMIDDYGYMGINFRNDPDLVLPEGEDWDVALGKKNMLSLLPVVMFFEVFMIL